MKKVIPYLTLFVSSISYGDPASAERIQAHIAIKDYRSACDEAKRELAKGKKDPDLYRSYINALASVGREREMLAVLKESGQRNREILETVSWGVVEKGANSPAIMTRVYSLAAAFYSQDMRGVNLIHRNLNDSNAMIRWVSAQLAGGMRDRKLQEALIERLDREHHPLVRVQIIESLGKTRYAAAKAQLLRLINHSSLPAEERFAATQALVSIIDDISLSELRGLVGSNRAALRVLGCQLVRHQDKKEALELIKPLSRDSNSSVRAAAIITLGWYSEVPDINDDNHTDVAIAIAWGAMRRGDSRADLQFGQLLNHSDKRVRRKAAGALAGCGSYGVALMKKTLDHPDPLVKANVAVGLIGQRQEVNRAAEVLAEVERNFKERLMWREADGYRALTESDVVHHPVIPQYPEAIDQSTRLELINILATTDYSGVEKAVHQFLKQRAWGISGMASALLLTESDNSAIEIVEKMLEDPDRRVRTQAALVLSLWGKHPKAIETLEKSYAGANRDLKEKILEGVGRVGDDRSIPFLVACLEDGHQTLRVLAAMSLLQTLYH